MVQLQGFTAVNDAEDQAAAALTRTLEAQEAIVVECYERALGLVRSKDLVAAEVCGFAFI